MYIYYPYEMLIYFMSNGHRKGLRKGGREYQKAQNLTISCNITTLEIETKNKTGVNNIRQSIHLGFKNNILLLCQTHCQGSNTWKNVKFHK